MPIKRWLLSALVLPLLAIWPSQASALSPIRVVIDGRPVHFPDIQPVIENGRVLVPARALAEGLDAEVAWYPTSRTVYMTNVRYTAQITVGSTHAWSDTWMFQLDVPPTIMNDRTMLPARFVAEALGASVDWDGETRTVKISTTGPITAPP